MDTADPLDANAASSSSMPFDGIIEAVNTWGSAWAAMARKRCIQRTSAGKATNEQVEDMRRAHVLPWIALNLISVLLMASQAMPLRILPLSVTASQSAPTVKNVCP